MNILALNFNQKGVGTWRRSFYFSRELARSGHDVTLMTVSRTSRFQRVTSYKRDWVGETHRATGPGPWVRLIEGPCWGYRMLPGWGSGPLDIWDRLIEILGCDYDAVLGFEHHPNVSWPVYLTQWRKPFSFFSDWCDWFGGGANHFRGWRAAQRLDSFLEEKIRTRAQRVSVTSRALLERALSIGIPTNRIVHVPEGAATDYVVPQPIERARAYFDLPAEAPIVLATRNGDMCREVRVFRELLREIPGALLLLLGNSSRPAIALAERLGVASRIVSTGWVSDPDYPLYLACADVCFCPLADTLNDRARWPAKILDYLAAGRATVANAVGEVEELFRRSTVGVLAPESDAEFAAAIVTLLRDPDRRRFFGERARQVMVDEWDWQVRGPLVARVVV